MSDIHSWPPWWTDRWDRLDDVDLDYEDPEPPAATSWYTEDEPRIDSWWDEGKKPPMGIDPLINRPYVEDDLPTYEQIHATVAPTQIPPGQLHPTQPMLNLARLLALHRGEPAEGPDPHPHIVLHHGALWVHNGHHRWIRALLRGDPTITVRVTGA